MTRRILTAREQLQMLSPWREASAAQDEAEARGERLPALPIRRQRLQDEYWMKKPWAESETLLRPHGKNVTLYHRTSPEEADRLVEKGFKRKKNTDEKDVYFSDVLGDAKAEDFGDAIVKMVLPHHLIDPRQTAPQTVRHRRLDDPNDTDWHQDGPAENWYAIDSKHLKGLPVERIATFNPATAALSEDEGQKMREVYAPHDPANPPEHLRPHLMLPIGAAHHYREYDRPYDDVLGQVIADQGIRQPLRISTDGTHATMHEGNHRLEIAKRLGLTHVPVQVTLEKPGEVINNGGRPPAPLESHLGDWVDQNRHRLKSFWKG